MKSRGRSVNADTEWQNTRSIDRDNHADPRTIGEVRDRERILRQNVDIKTAFRQVGVASDPAVAFAYRLKGLIFVNL